MQACRFTEGSRVDGSMSGVTTVPMMGRRSSPHYARCAWPSGCRSAPPAPAAEPARQGRFGRPHDTTTAEFFSVATGPPRRYRGLVLRYRFHSGSEPLTTVQLSRRRNLSMLDLSPATSSPCAVSCSAATPYRRISRQPTPRARIRCGRSASAAATRRWTSRRGKARPVRHPCRSRRSATSLR